MQNLKKDILSLFYTRCIDNNLVPYITTLLTKEVKGLEQFTGTTLTLNTGINSAINFFIDDSAITFETRFNKVSTKVYIPLGNIISIFPRENPEYGINFIPNVVDTSFINKRKDTDRPKLSVVNNVFGIKGDK